MNKSRVPAGGLSTSTYYPPTPLRGVERRVRLCVPPLLSPPLDQKCAITGGGSKRIVGVRDDKEADVFLYWF